MKITVIINEKKLKSNEKILKTSKQKKEKLTKIQKKKKKNLKRTEKNERRQKNMHIKIFKTAYEQKESKITNLKPLHIGLQFKSKRK